MLIIPTLIVEKLDDLALRGTALLLYVDSGGLEVKLRQYRRKEP